MIDSFQPSLEIPQAENRSFDPMRDFVDLVFLITTEPKEIDGTTWLGVEGELNGTLVGFDIGVSDRTSEVKIKDGEVTSMKATPSGVTLKSNGAQSDEFVGALARLYRRGDAAKRMVPQISFTSLALSDDPKQLLTQPIHFKLFFDRRSSNPDSADAKAFFENDYFEMYLNFDLPNRRVYLKEKDIEYRVPQLRALSVS